MPRTSKEADYTIRKNEILDSAQRLIFTKGYDAMTIQDILGDLQISKGAFYHYFRSKHELLEGLINRSIEQAGSLVAPILEDPDLTSLAKLTRYFDAVSSWKIAQKEYMIQLLRVWYKDTNSLFRQKMTAAGVEFLTPTLTKLIHQGVEEGVMKVDDPRTTAKVVYFLMMSLGDELGGLILSLDKTSAGKEKENCYNLMKGTNEAFTAAIERTLGIRKDSISLISDAALAQWIL